MALATGIADQVREMIDIRNRAWAFGFPNEKQKQTKKTVTCCLLTGICSEKCVLR